jgi:hypothetical protein
MKFTGQPNIFDLNPFEESSVQMHQLGARGELADGRIFRYGKTGEAIDIGRVTVSAAIDATLINCAVTTAAAIGAKEIAFTNAATTATANEYAEGFLGISYGTGLGQTLKVSSHAALTSGGASTVYLEDPVQVALNTTSKVELTHNPYKGVMMTATSVTFPTGGALRTFTSTYYGWFQTRGVFYAIADGTVTAGYGMMTDASTAGDVDLVGTATQQYIIGNFIKASASGYFHPVFLKID